MFLESIQRTKFCRLKILILNIHGPSLGIGAGIAAISIIAAFVTLNVVNSENELVLEQNTPSEPSNTQLTSLELFTSNASPILGDPNAPITLVEFGDYQCFFCNKFFHETEASIISNYVETGKVKLIFKDFTIIGPDSITAAHATHCANDQGKFWEFHDILYNKWDGENNGWASSENLLRFAEEIGLDIEQYTSCMTDSKYQQLITASNEDARALGLTGTPGFFVIGKDNKIGRISGAQPFNVFERIFETELQK